MAARSSYLAALTGAALLLIAMPIVSCSPDASTPEIGAIGADLVIWGGSITTMDDAQPSAEAVIIEGDRIVAVTSRAEAEKRVGDNTQVIDLEGRRAIPGFIDAHAHFISLGDKTTQLPLEKAESWSDVVEMVRLAAVEAEPGTWIRGRGWHQDKWSDQPARKVDGFPSHDEISAVSPENPVLLRHASGHMSLVNAKAMEAGGIVDTTADPDGGTIVRDNQKHATGLFNETAQGLIDSALAEQTAGADAAAHQARLIAAASRECQQKGVTSMHDAGSTLAEIEALQSAADQGQLGTRLWVMLGQDNAAIADHLETAKRQGSWLTVGGIKRYMDGALGSRGALLLEPYSDDPSTSGLQLTPMDELRVTAEMAKANGLQLAVHAIGDKANRDVLDLFADFVSPEDDLRWRIEHSQHLNVDDISRFGELGVIASVQTVHCTSDGPWVPERLGDERSREEAYVWQKLLATNAVLINGTDAPVEDVDPLANFAAAVTRLMPRTGESFYAEQALSREQALRAMTLDAAYGAFQEDEVGSLEVGKLADIVVLSHDIMTIDDAELPNARVAMTVLGGKVVYQATP